MSSLIRISDWFDSLISNLVLNYVDDLCVLECVPQGLILEMGHELLAQILSKKCCSFINENVQIKPQVSIYHSKAFATYVFLPDWMTVTNIKVKIISTSLFFSWLINPCNQISG